MSNGRFTKGWVGWDLKGIGLGSALGWVGWGWVGLGLRRAAVRCGVTVGGVIE